jgi:hypothetical protein
MRPLAGLAAWQQGNKRKKKGAMTIILVVGAIPAGIVAVLMFANIFGGMIGKAVNDNKVKR